MWKNKAAIALCLVALSIPILSPAATTLETIKTKGEIAVGVLGDTPPFGFRDAPDGSLQGYDVDYAQALATELGVKLRLVEVPSQNRIAPLLGGQVDLLAAGLNHSELRNTIVAESDHYLVSGQKVIAPKGLIKTNADLSRKRIGVVIGTYSESCVRGSCPISTTVTFDNYIDGITALKKGEIDVFAADESMLVNLASAFSLSQFEIPDVTILKEEFHLALRRDEKELMHAVDDAIAALEKSGRAAEIRSKWFVPAEQSDPPAYGAVVRSATARNRFYGVALQGVLYPDAPVTIYGLDGVKLGDGTVVSTFGEEFYMDVGPELEKVIRPGVLVTMNMTEKMAYDVLTERKDLLQNVRKDANEEASAVEEQIREEALQKEERQNELFMMRERERIRNRRDYDYYRYRYRYYR